MRAAMADHQQQAADGQWHGSDARRRALRRLRTTPRGVGWLFSGGLSGGRGDGRSWAEAPPPHATFWPVERSETASSRSGLLEAAEHETARGRDSGGWWRNGGKNRHGSQRTAKRFQRRKRRRTKRQRHGERVGGGRRDRAAREAWRWRDDDGAAAMASGVSAARVYSATASDGGARCRTDRLDVDAIRRSMARSKTPVTREEVGVEVSRVTVGEAAGDPRLLSEREREREGICEGKGSGSNVGSIRRNAYVRISGGDSEVMCNIKFEIRMLVVELFYELVYARNLVSRKTNGDTPRVACRCGTEIVA
ncbi:hypothetical protein Scep_024289 [Stephania cephalantha]|uniref:Uncharacterized protein n=1 Tax=Stephania cephalantha TaxID=152367 RepID=A0AAP0HY96_9MAGN